MPWTSSFKVQNTPPRSVTVLDSSNGTAPANSLNTALQNLVNTCINHNLFSLLCGQHSELCQITSATSFSRPIYVERFATSLFGLTMRGAHLVAYTQTQDKGMQIWIPRRAPHLFICGGMLDTTVAGGIKGAASPLQTIIEEADEEASLPASLIERRIRSRGVISHMGLTGPGFPGEQGLVTPDFVYVYDIELPVDVLPRPHDEEVSSFQSMGVEELKSRMLSGEFKPDSAAVLVDFLITHGFISADDEADFVEITMRLHRRLPFRTSR